MNTKYLIIFSIGLITIGTTLFAIADNNDKCPNWSANARECVMLNHIIDQNDWTNCVLKHKEARGYNAPNNDNYGWDVQDFNSLVKHCGEMP